VRVSEGIDDVMVVFFSVCVRVCSMGVKVSGGNCGVGVSGKGGEE